MKKRKRRSKKNTILTKMQKVSKLTKFLVICIIIILVYTIVELILSTKFDISHDTLTTCVYAFFGTELASCAAIKICNVLKIGNKDKEEEE